MSVSTLQSTIASRIDISGVGVHSGETVNISLVPAEANTGIVFDRIDLENLPSTLIQAVSKNVGPTDLCTVIANEHGASVQTIEHLMAALSAMDVDNIIVEIDGAEVPVMDGSSRVFVEAIDKVGLVAQTQARQFIKVLAPVRVSQDAAMMLKSILMMKLLVANALILLCRLAYFVKISAQHVHSALCAMLSAFGLQASRLVLHSTIQWLFATKMALSTQKVCALKMNL